MNTVTPSRREVMRAVAALSAGLPTLAFAAPVSAAIATSDSEWMEVVADFRSKHARWLAEEDVKPSLSQEYEKACASLSPEPQSPGSGLPDDILEMTLAEIRAAGNDPAHKEAWAIYERDHAVWKMQNDALRENIFGPSKALEAANYAKYAAALDALAKYRVRTLSDLGEKMEIIVSDYAGSEIPEDYLAAFIADVRRLGGEVSL